MTTREYNDEEIEPPRRQLKKLLQKLTTTPTGTRTTRPYPNGWRRW